MIKILSTILYTIQIITQHCQCLDLIELPQNSLKQKVEITASEMYEPYPLPNKHRRRYWLVNEKPNDKVSFKAVTTYEDEKDANLKNKISALVEQTMHDAQRKMKNIEEIKEKYREETPYRVGFVLNLVKKSRDVLNELFNVAVKHRQEWQALEQLKIFELIVHTNVDTTNLLRQLVDIHLSSKDSSSDQKDSDKKRVILL